MNANLKCSDLVNQSCQNRLEDIRIMLDPRADDVRLIDDGTTDTVLQVGDEEFRYADTSSYRDESTGELDLDSFLEDYYHEIQETMYERFNEYGLSFDYVEPETFDDQPEAYFRYQISYGGPSEEVRFYVNPDYSLYRCEFWYLNWFDGASVTLDINDPVVSMIWDQFLDYAHTLVEEA